MVELEEPTLVRVRRNSLLHRWCIVKGSHETPTPWTDTADAVLVSVWIRDRADGPVKIRFEL
jgi:hypothetical protein